MGVQEGRKVGLVVAEASPWGVGVQVDVAVLLGLGVRLAVLEGTGVEVGSAEGKKSPKLHPKMVNSSTNIATPIHSFLFCFIVRTNMIFLYLLTRTLC
jgi:hypothetical protein